MSAPPSPTLAEAVRAALPQHLHRLVEPVVAYLEAAVALRDLVSDPSASAAVAQALTSLRGTEIPLPAGVVTFGANTNLGDVTMRDVAGRDVINLSITLPASAPPKPSHGLDDGQLRLLRMLTELPTRSAPVNHATFAERIGLTAEEVEDELELLRRHGLLSVKHYAGASIVEVTPTGRKLLRTIDQGSAI